MRSANEWHAVKPGEVHAVNSMQMYIARNELRIAAGIVLKQEQLIQKHSSCNPGDFSVQQQAYSVDSYAALQHRSGGICMSGKSDGTLLPPPPLHPPKTLTAPAQSVMLVSE